MALPRKQRIPLFQLFLVILIAVAKAASEPMPQCTTSCGSLNIPYPFGTSEGCYLDDSFFINCTHDKNSSTPIPFLGHDNIPVLNISLDGELLVSSPVVHDCYGMKNIRPGTYPEFFNLTHFTVSPSRNIFTTLGCDTAGYFSGYVSRKKDYTTGGACLSVCAGLDDITSNGSCSGIGCCHSSIPKGLTGFVLQTTTHYNHSKVHDFNPCGYAFIAEEGAYNFFTTDLKNFMNKTVPTVLDWAVGNQTCQEVRSHACKAGNSECYNSPTGVGYRCKCLPGFRGNPYLVDGCQDIDECSMEPNPCSRICQNIPGSFTCSCPKEYEGDGMRSGTGCHRKGKSWGNLILIVSLSVSLCALALLVGSLYLYSRLQQRKLIKIGQKYFQQNGGLLLQQHIARHKGSTERAKIFSAEELKKATNNYDEFRIIGKGGHGTVFRGVLLDGKVVAIKKSKISNQCEIEQFINEVVVLSQINHKNVVKLMGCCLETEVPLLVYEFITNGTLSDHLHIEGQASQLSWRTRLRVATETAEALTYLHSAASTPIIHRDVKTANILLDDNLIAKVSDFGASKLVPLDQTQLTTLVQGTLGYLDPEYFQTSKLTEKSDVYSFGVVLAELITGKKALSFVRPESERILSTYFVSSMMEGCLYQILDNDIVNDANLEQIIEVANIAKKCLMLKGEERPTMKEVAMELEGLRIMEKQALGAAIESEVETEYMLKLPVHPNIVDNRDADGIGSRVNSGLPSMQHQILQSLESLGDGR